jgi:hypothetical protein
MWAPSSGLDEVFECTALHPVVSLECRLFIQAAEDSFLAAQELCACSSWSHTNK